MWYCRISKTRAPRSTYEFILLLHAVYRPYLTESPWQLSPARSHRPKCHRMTRNVGRRERLCTAIIWKPVRCTLRYLRLESTIEYKIHSVARIQNINDRISHTMDLRSQTALKRQALDSHHALGLEETNRLVCTCYTDITAITSSRV